MQRFADLRLLSERLVDYKATAISALGGTISAAELENVRQEARAELIADLGLLFEAELTAPCLAVVRGILRGIS
jgi:hypothetical protein